MFGTRSFSRSLTAFAIGAAASAFASRVMPPMAGRAIGRARVAAGGDPFDALAADHRRVLATIDTLLQSDDSATMRRTTGLLQVKRSLTAHALAEEDIVYPLLREEVGAIEAADRLYREHAELKIHLFRLEHMPKNDLRWREELQDLRELIASHAGDEENEQFPKLRARLSREQTARLSSDVEREKQFVL
jgi:hemerythrin superfamily protein